MTQARVAFKKLHDARARTAHKPVWPVKPPALDRKPVLPKGTNMRAKGLPERPIRATPLLERVN
jgi:hypothetical protein